MRKILSVLMVLFTAIILVGCINEDSSFNIYFVTNGGSPLETIKISEVFEASSLENYDTERSGYDFISWHTSGSLSDETIAGGSYFSDTTFYAKWQQSTEESKYYQVTFDSQGGTNIDELEVLAGGHVNAPTKPERRGYEFTGWQLDGVDYDFEQAVNSDLLLVATWKLIEGEVTTYTVTFKGEDEIVYFSDEVVAGNSVNMPSNPVMDGHKFIGWELNGNPFDFNTLITSDIVLYAVWEEIVYYRVTFNTLGGSLVDEVLVEEGLKVLKPNNPTKDNYEFVEWQLEGESFEFKTSINSDLTLDAVWTELTQNVKKLDYLNSINDYQVDNYDEYNFHLSGLPSTGTLDVLVVPVEIKGTPFPSDYKFDLDKTFNGTSLDTGWESVSSYYDKSSYGRLSLSFDITDKYITDQNASFYNSYENEDGYNIADELITVEAMQAIDSNIDFSKYDFNNDGIIDSVIFVYSVDHTTYEDDNNPWWAWVYVNEDEYHFDNKEFGYYMWVGYYFMDEPLGPGFEGNVEYNAETYIHEMGHLFGLDDYYEQDVEKYSFLGDFDMMDRNQGDHGPFNKLILGWIEPLIIEESGIYEITLDSFTNYQSNLNNVLIISKGNFDSNYGYSEYLAIVYYQPKGLYEKHLSDSYYNVPNKAGFIIYHINATLSNDPWYWELFEYSNYDVSAKPLVRILEADQNNSLSGNNPINNNDILSSGSILLNSFRWHDGTTINVNISVGNLSENDASLGVILSQN